MLDGLVGRAVFAEADRVMGHHVDDLLAHQCREADGRAGIVGEDEEGAAIGDEAAVQRDAVHRGRHLVLADAVAHVAAEAILGGEGQGLGSVGEVRAGEVGRAADGLGQQLVDDFQRHLARLAGSDLRLVGDELGLERFDGRVPVVRQLAGGAALELGALRRIGGGEAAFPGATQVGRAGAGGAPGVEDVSGDFEGGVGDAELRLGGSEFLGAERRAVHRVRVGLLGRAVADDGLGGDQGGLVRALRGDQGLLDGVLVEAVDLDGVPAAGLEAGDLVGRVGVGDAAVDGDVVVVPDHRQLVELEVPGERDGFLRDAFHQATVAGDHPGAVIDEVGAELGGELGFGDGEADGVGEALAERAGGGLDAVGVAVFGMAGGLGAELAEVPDVVDRHVLVAEEVERGIEQHRAVAGRQDEAVAIGPVRVGRIELHDLGEQHRRYVRHAHRQARMTRIGLFDRIHREGADGVGHIFGGGGIGHGRARLSVQESPDFRALHAFRRGRVRGLTGSFDLSMSAQGMAPVAIMLRLRTIMG